MPVIRTSFLAEDFLSEDVRGAIHRRIREIGGIGLLAIAAAAAMALASWSVQDPSLSHATAAPVRNLLGAPGAIVADLLLQLVGLASIALVLPIAVWGWRLLTHRSLDRERLRLVLWIVGALAATAFASSLPATRAWPLPTGLGGVIGDALLRVPASLMHAPLSGALRIAIGGATGMAAMVALAFSMGLGWRDRIEGEPEDAASDPAAAEERSFVSLGWIHHGILSLRARLGRLFRTAGRRAAPQAPKIRIEPASAESDDEAWEEEAEDEEDGPAPRPRRRARSPARTGTKRSRSGFELPSLSLLTAPKSSDRTTLSAETIQENATALESVLADFGVRGEIINAHPGPVVTLYELEPAPGIKSSRVIGLSDDIARSMSALSARVAVVPGRNAIGIELPNPKREKVLLREMLASSDYTDTQARLPLCLGKTIGGDPVIVDLARMQQLLIACTSGSGKSVAINTMILSLVYRLRPEECKLIMVDPKMLELSVYDGIPHLLTPVVTDPKKAVVALKWAVREMEER